jgi:hypothetical protein
MPTYNKQVKLLAWMTITKASASLLRYKENEDHILSEKKTNLDFQD